jgi:hypothetical protein
VTIGVILLVVALVLAVVRLAGVNDGRLTAIALILVILASLVGSF